MDCTTRIVVDHDVRFGKPVIKGTRICASDILEFLSTGDSESDILADYPQISTEDIRACLAFEASKAR